MSDSAQGTAVVEDNYNFHIHGGVPGAELVIMVRTADRTRAHTACFHAGTEKDAIAHGVLAGLRLILKHSQPKYGLPGPGITASDLRAAIASALSRSHPGQQDVATSKVMTDIVSKVKRQSDKQRTQSRLLTRAGIGA